MISQIIAPKLLAGLLLLSIMVSGSFGYLVGLTQNNQTLVETDDAGNTVPNIVKYCTPAWTGEQPPWSISYLGEWNGTYRIYICRVS